MLTGVILSVLVPPLLVLLINVTLFRDLPRWELGNFERLDYVVQWCRATWDASQSDTAEFAELPPASAPSLSATAARMPVSKTFLLYGNALRRGFGGLFGLAWIVGFVVGRRRLLCWDHAILFLVAGCIAAAAWVHLWYGQATSSRYFLAMVLLACPCSAIGGLWLNDRLIGVMNRIGCDGWHRLATTVAAAFLVAAGVGESLADRHDGRSREAALGRWLRAEMGRQGQIATLGPMPLVGFYAETNPTVLIAGKTGCIDLPVDHRLDAIVAHRHAENAALVERMIDCLNQSCYGAIDVRRLPDGYDWSDLALLMKGDAQFSQQSVAQAERRQGP